MDQIFRCSILVVSLMLPSLLHSESFGRHVSIENIEVNKEGRVRRTRIYYLRELTGKKARIKEQTR